MAEGNYNSPYRTIFGGDNEMTMKISEICDELRQRYLSEEEREANSVNKLAVRINKLLISRNDLTESAIGKIETAKGRSHGICGEYRELESGESYWQPLYSEQGKQYVESLFLANKDGLLDQPAAPVEAPPTAPAEPTYRYARTDRMNAKRAHQNLYRIYLLEGPDRYWAYDEDALLLANTFDIRVNETPRGQNLKFIKEDLGLVLKHLESLQISYCILHPDNEETFSPTTTARIGYGTKFTVRDQGNEKWRFIILNEEDVIQQVISIVRPDGTIEMMTVPVSEIEGYQRLSPAAPMARAMNGARVGDRRTCAGKSYEVLEIQLC